MHLMGWRRDNKFREEVLDFYPLSPVNQRKRLFLSIIIDSSIRKELSLMSRFPFLPSDRMIYLSIQLVDFFSGNECFAMGSDKETYIS